MNMYIEQCQKCNGSIRCSASSNGFFISGCLVVYKDGAKNYLRECCYKKYLVGSHNYSCTSYDEENRLYAKHKGKSKIMICTDKKYDVYEASVPKSLKTIRCNARGTNASLPIIRDIFFDESTDAYKIYTNSEYKKYLDREEKQKQLRLSPVVQSVPDCKETFQYVYMIQTLADINSNQAIYKIGKTTQDNLKRFTQYDKGSKLYIHIKCHNCDLVEQALIELFKQKYTQMLDRGVEYFQGSNQDMIRDIVDIVFQGFPECQQ